MLMLIYKKQNITTFNECIYSTFLLQRGCDIKSFLKLSTVGLNLEFSFSSSDFLTKKKEVSLNYNLSIAGAMDS